MNHDEHDELWDLLGKARAPKERPFFAAKVLQAVRAEEEKKALGWGGRVASFWATVRRRWVISLAGSSAVLAAAAVAVLSLGPSMTPETSKPAPTVATTVAADPLAGLITAADDVDQLAASLDNLLATQDNSLWLQADLSSLY